MFLQRNTQCCYDSIWPYIHKRQPIEYRLENLSVLLKFSHQWQNTNKKVRKWNNNQQILKTSSCILQHSRTKTKVTSNECNFYFCLSFVVPHQQARFTKHWRDSVFHVGVIDAFHEHSYLFSSSQKGLQTHSFPASRVIFLQRPNFTGPILILSSRYVFWYCLGE